MNDPHGVLDSQTKEILINRYANVYVLHGTKTNGNLDCSYHETYAHKKFSGILHACKMVELYIILNTLT